MTSEANTKPTTEDPSRSKRYNKNFCCPKSASGPYIDEAFVYIKRRPKTSTNKNDADNSPLNMLCVLAMMIFVILSLKKEIFHSDSLNRLGYCESKFL